MLVLKKNKKIQNENKNNLISKGKLNINKFENLR